MTEIFLYLDWVPLPSRITPRPRQGDGSSDTSVFLELRHGDAIAGGLRQLYKLKARVANEREPDTVDEIAAEEWVKSIETGERENTDTTGDEIEILKILVAWLSENESLALSIAGDAAGIIAIAISAGRDRREQHVRPGESEAEEIAKAMRQHTRDRFRADHIAMLAAHAVRLSVAQTHGDTSTLHRIRKHPYYLFEVDQLPLQPVPVKPRERGGDTGEIARNLLRNRELFEAEAEAADVGGAGNPSPSREAFLSLSTRYGALVDRVLPALEPENENATRPRADSEKLIRGYTGSAIALFAVFAGLIGVPHVFPRLVPNSGMTVFEYGLFFAAFFACSAVLYFSTYGSERSWLGHWSARFVSSRAAYLLAVLLFLFWIWLRHGHWRADGLWITDAAIPGESTLRNALKVAIWGLPALAVTMLKHGRDRFDTIVKTVENSEERLNVLGRLETSVGYAQRFAHSTKAAFESLAADDPGQSQLKRLLVLELARADIANARRKIAAAIDQAKSDHARRAGVTALLGLLLLSGSIIGKLQPDPIARPGPRPEDLAGARYAAYRDFGAAAYTPSNLKPLTRAAFDSRKCRIAEHSAANKYLSCTASENSVYLATLEGLVIEARIEKRLTDLLPTKPVHDVIDLVGAREAAYRDFSTADGLDGPIVAAFAGQKCRIARRPAANEDPPCVDAEKTIYLATLESLVMEARIEKRIADLARDLDEQTVELVIPGIDVRMTDIRSDIEAAFAGAYVDGLKTRLRLTLLEGLNEAISLADARPLRNKTFAEVRGGTERAFDTVYAGPLKPKVRDLIREAIEEAGLTANLWPFRERLEYEIRTAFETAMREAKFSTIDRSLNDIVTRTIRESIGPVFVGDLRTRLWPEIEVSVKRALQQEHELNLSAVALTAAAQDKLIRDLTLVVIGLFEDGKPVRCTAKDGTDFETSLVACLAKQIEINLPEIPVEAGSRPFMPQVPDRCKDGLKARAYFFKPYEEQTQFCHFYSSNGLPDAEWLAAKCDGEIGERLASDLRFSAELGDWAAKELAAETGKEIVVAGYADSTGRPQDNLQFASNRAKKVKEILRLRLPSRVISAIGRGEEAFSSLPGNELPFPAETPLSRRVDIYLCD